MKWCIILTRHLASSRISAATFNYTQLDFDMTLTSLKLVWIIIWVVKLNLGFSINYEINDDMIASRVMTIMTLSMLLVLTISKQLVQKLRGLKSPVFSWFPYLFFFFKIDLQSIFDIIPSLYNCFSHCFVCNFCPPLKTLNARYC